ncbi:thioesterase II family protein [Dactylosporangium salmoneum]|uniref:Alpha/beta fold hydrolase n=1 Tax=Dactylosporangium salmoneum TaxID=53361 RepID=A0ABN3G6T7_9ACTN
MTQLTSAQQTWIRRFHPAPGAAVRLVCFAHAGGSASFFFPVSARMAPATDVFALQYPGRQDRRAEPNIDSISRLADAAFGALEGLLDRPTAFFGHSMGAVLAYEVALRFEAAGGAPLLRLYASGRRAPSRYREEALHQQGEQSIIAELRELDGTGGGLLDDPDALAMIMPAIRNDYRAIETYRHTPGQALSCPVTAVIGDRDPRVSAAEARAWADHTTGPFDLRVFPGGHFYLVDQSARLIQLIRDDLTAAAASKA